MYYSVDEYKGKTEVSRDGLKFRLNEKMFNNPFLSPAYEGEAARREVRGRGFGSILVTFHNGRSMMRSF